MHYNNYYSSYTKHKNLISTFNGIINYECMKLIQSILILNKHILKLKVLIKMLFFRWIQRHYNVAHKVFLIKQFLCSLLSEKIQILKMRFTEMKKSRIQAVYILY